MNKPNSSDDFQNGLVFGFDVGTGSIGYAVRKGRDFKDVGVLICDSEGSDLSKRRELRRQRRTLRSKKYRRQWFAKELINLGLPKPETAAARSGFTPAPRTQWRSLETGRTSRCADASFQAARLFKSAMGKRGKGREGKCQAKER